jgi:hypothetical protein
MQSVYPLVHERRVTSVACIGSNRFGRTVRHETIGDDHDD